MSNSNLDLIIRKNKGKHIVEKYYNMFLQAGFSSEELNHIDLKLSDELINSIRNIFSVIEKQEVEILSGECNPLDSVLLSSMLTIDSTANSYIFSDDVDYCGMYMASNKTVLAHCLNVAKSAYSNTCFILDENLTFSFTINFYESTNKETTAQFDIQLKSIAKR